MNKKQKEKSAYLTPQDLESQEHLSLARIQAMTPKFDSVGLERPSANFIDLMIWAQDSFGIQLKDQKNLSRYVHNRIIVDGQFMQFCEEKGVKLECLYRDSAISWKTDHNFEKFFLQGVFHIHGKGLEFLHAALFHKGNQHEDEVSFFVIASEKNY